MNLVITMSRRFGTGASMIAEELSEKLGIPVYDKAYIENELHDNNFANEISKLLGISVIGTGVGGVKIIDKTPISDIVSGKIDNSKIISIREAGKIIKKNKPPIYEIPPQPKPKLETMNDGGGSNPVSDKSSIALPLKDSIRDSILSTRSTKATAVTQQETNM